MSKEKELRSNKMSAPGSSRLSSPPSFSKDDSHTILHRMPRNGNPRDLFSCLFGALPFSPTAISLYLPVYSCQARPLLIIYGIIIPERNDRRGSGGRFKTSGAGSEIFLLRTFKGTVLGPSGGAEARGIDEPAKWLQFREKGNDNGGV